MTGNGHPYETIPLSWGRPRGALSGRRTRPRRARPVVEALEGRCLLSAKGWLDAPWRAYSTGVFPNVGNEVMAAGDMDADGDADVVTANDYWEAPGIPNRIGGVSVLKNQGDGSFGPPQFFREPFNYLIEGIALADHDVDGDMDVFITTNLGSGFRRGKLVVYRNQGDGTLALPAQSYDAGREPYGVAVGDFTGDGFPDVVTANHGVTVPGDGTVSLFRHNGLTGAAAGLLPQVTFPVGQYARGLDAADLNGDGRLDLAVARTRWDHRIVGELTILLNDGAGGFGAPADYRTLTGPRPYYYSPSVALADLDNDGDQDLISGGYDDDFLEYGAYSVRRNAGDGTFGPIEVYNFASFTSFPRHLATADLNADGFDDVVGVTGDLIPNADGYAVLLSNGTGGFHPARFYEASWYTYAVAVADADRDGDRDVLTLSRSAALITVHRNPGGGVFAEPARYPVSGPVDAADAADVDRDGDLDVVINRGLYVAVLKNHGDGTFAPAQLHATPRDMKDLKLRDLNGDNYPDILMGPDADFPPYHFATMLNRGDGTFAPGVVWPVFSCGEGRIEAADLDNDGDRDVVLTEEQGCFGGLTRNIFIYRNEGNATFTRMAPVQPSTFPRGIAVADLNHDGNLDLVTGWQECGGFCRGMGVFLGNGDLTFRPPLISSAAAAAFLLADFNRDGELDLGLLAAPANPINFALYVAVALGNGDGTFGPATFYLRGTLFGPGIGLEDLDAADLNGDGAFDLLVTSRSHDGYQLFLGSSDGRFSGPQHYGAGASHPRFSAFADFSGDGVPDVASDVDYQPDGGSGGLILLRGLPKPSSLSGLSRSVAASRGLGVNPLDLPPVPFAVPAPAAPSTPAAEHSAPASTVPPDLRRESCARTAPVGERQRLGARTHGGALGWPDEDWLNFTLQQV